MAENTFFTNVKVGKLKRVEVLLEIEQNYSLTCKPSSAPKFPWSLHRRVKDLYKRL